MNYTLHQTIQSEAPCKLCGGRELQVIGTQGRHFQKLTTTICKGCGLIHSYPIPTKEELDAYYCKQYRSEYKGAYTPQRKHILRYSRSSILRIKQLLQFSSKGQKLLDVGSGSGEFAYMASLSGFDVHGLEPHEGYSEYTRKTFGIHIITAPLEKADIAPESYDIITLNHVLEHLHYPLTSLSHLNRWLKMGGVLAVEVPNIETTHHSPVNRFHYAHVYNFNHDTLKAILEKTGFTVELHPDFTSTTLFARKTGKPDPDRIIAMPENYKRLLDLMSKEVAAENYRKKKPLKRFLGKCIRYPLEFIEAMIFWNPRRIVKREFTRANSIFSNHL
jgi:2-polyprenyl-3-methyl-5-hydroxy-6-metoxy-1,4-benzoquinol methylase